MADQDNRPNVTEKTKKQIVKGRKRDLLRDQKLKSHVTGPSCNCKRLKCFESTTELDRKRIIEYFNLLETKNEQDRLLASFISVNEVMRRRSRKENGEQFFLNHSYKYYVTILRVEEMKMNRIEVCLNGFCSIFDVGKMRLRRIRKALLSTGEFKLNFLYSF